MYIPFLAKQKTNAWQLGVLPCVFGMLFYFTGQYDFGSKMGSIALVSAAVALLGFVLTGGLRACGIGLCLFLLFTVTLGRNRLWVAPVIALSAYILVCLVRAALPKKVLTPAARAGFRSFFWIAGLGVSLIICLRGLILLLLLRE